MKTINFPSKKRTVFEIPYSSNFCSAFTVIFNDINTVLRKLFLLIHVHIFFIIYEFYNKSSFLHVHFGICPVRSLIIPLLSISDIFSINSLIKFSLCSYASGPLVFSVNLLNRRLFRLDLSSSSEIYLIAADVSTLLC